MNWLTVLALLIVMRSIKNRRRLDVKLCITRMLPSTNVIKGKGYTPVIEETDEALLTPGSLEIQRFTNGEVKPQGQLGARWASADSITFSLKDSKGNLAKKDRDYSGKNYSRATKHKGGKGGIEEVRSGRHLQVLIHSWLTL